MHKIAEKVTFVWGITNQGVEELWSGCIMSKTTCDVKNANPFRPALKKNFSESNI